MTLETLGYINNLLTEAGVNYAFGRFNGSVSYPYWVGEYTENESVDEDHESEADFILTGTTENSWYEIHQDREKIQKLFTELTSILSSGIGVSINYERTLIVPTETEQLKRIQIDLSVKEWRNY